MKSTTPTLPEIILRYATDKRRKPRLRRKWWISNFMGSRPVAELWYSGMVAGSRIHVYEDSALFGGEKIHASNPAFLRIMHLAMRNLELAKRRYDRMHAKILKLRNAFIKSEHDRVLSILGKVEK